MATKMLANEMVSIDHSSPDRGNVLVVDWMIGNLCNYNCSYCPSSLHDGSRPWIQRDRIRRFAERLAKLCSDNGRRLYIQFLGGEVTILEGFIELLAELKRRSIALAIISNGSRGLAWWSEAINYLDEVVLTFHPERANLNHFRGIVYLLSQNIRTHINVAAPPNLFDVAVSAARNFADCDDTTITLKPLFVDFGNILYEYSDEQLRLLREMQLQPRLTRPLNSVRGEMTATFADGNTRKMKSSQFIVEELNHWTRWECNIGIELISVKYSGEVFRGLCQEGGVIGHIDSPDNFELPTAPIRCTKMTCTCLLDIMTSRRCPSAQTRNTGDKIDNANT